MIGLGTNINLPTPGIVMTEKNKKQQFTELNSPSYDEEEKKAENDDDDDYKQPKTMLNPYNKENQKNKDHTIEFKKINLELWQQSDLNNDSERAHYVATYYDKKGSKLLLIGTVIQFSMLLLSLSGSYISSFGNFSDFSRSVLMSTLNLTTAVLSGVYTFFSFSKKGQIYKDSSNLLFHKIEKIKVAITTLKNDKDYEEIKRSLAEAILKYDTECIRENYNSHIYLPVYNDEVEQGLIRVLDKDNKFKLIRNQTKNIIEDKL
jgi:hypothetical protein